MTSPTKQRRIDDKAARKAMRDFVTEQKTFSAALSDAGFAKGQSQKGRALLLERPHLMKLYKDEVKKLMKRAQLLGEEMTAEQQESIVRGTLLDCAFRGEDGRGRGRVAASSWLGKDKRCSLFQSDVAVGVFSLQIPPDWQGRYITTESPNDLTAQGAETIPALLPAEPPKETEDEKLRRVTRELAGPLKDAAVHANPDLQREKIKQSKQPSDCYPSGTFRSNK